MHRQGVLAILIGVTLAGCPGGARRQAATAPPASAPLAAGAPELVLARDETPPKVCKEVPASRPERDQGIDAYLRGTTDAAVARFTAAMRAWPGDRAAAALRGAAQGKMAEENVAASAKAQTAQVVTLQLPRLDRVPGSISISDPKVRLIVESQKTNLITDQETWLKSNGLVSREVRSRDQPPGHVATVVRGVPLRVIFRSPDHDVAGYLFTLVVSAPRMRPLLFDVSQLVGMDRREITFAQLVGGILVVQLAYNGYAKDSGGRNGYLLAFDPDSGRLLWMSDPLVGNLTNFAVLGRSIVTGYGFTGEPDFLHVVDLGTGAIEQKVKLKSAPEYILVKDERLYVRTYDTDYVFRGQQPFPSTPGAALETLVDARSLPAMDSDARCWIRAGADAIDRHDDSALTEAMDELRKRFGDSWITVAFERLSAGARAGAPSIDLSLADLIRIAAPPWRYALVSSRPVPPGAPPSLLKISGVRADPVRSMAKRPFVPGKPSFIAPVERGALPPGAPPEIPSAYGTEHLRAIIPSGDRLLLVYGGRYLVSVLERRVEHLYDLDLLRQPPDPNPQWSQFAVQDVTFAQVLDDTLYVCNGGGSYAKEVHGKKGFVTALDVATGQLIWRSEPLVCNATFAMAGDYLVTGYGFTDEPDNLFLLRRADGKIMQRVRLDTGPETIALEERRIVVEAYAHHYIFELR
jgi:hypothetical protein